MAKRKKTTLKLVAFTDIHFTRQPPESRSITYGEDILNKVSQVAKLAKKEKADAVLCSGDWFHLKGEVTQREVQDMMEVLREFTCPVFTIWGNHDARAISSLQYRAYGTLVKSGLVQNVDEDTGVWGEVKGVRIIGRGFTDDYDKDGSKYMWSKEDKPTILLTHGMLVMKPDLVPMEYVESTLVDSLEGNKATAVINGHIHTSQGEASKDGCLYVFPGGVSRVASSEKDREVKAVVMSVDDGVAKVDKWVDLKVSPAKAAFVAGVQNSTSVEDVRAVAATLKPDGGDVVAEALQAVELAAASLGFGPEVISDAKRRLRDGEE